MESKQQLLEILSRLEQGKYKYLSELFRYVPNDVVKSISYKEIDKNQYLIQAENPCDMVYIILSGNVIGVGYPKTGQAYCFMDFTQTHIVGDFEVFANVSQYTSSVKTVDVCKVLVIPATYYLEWIKHDENAMYLRLQNIMSIVVLEKKMNVNGYL